MKRHPSELYLMGARSHSSFLSPASGDCWSNVQVRYASRRTPGRMPSPQARKLPASADRYSSIRVCLRWTPFCFCVPLAEFVPWLGGDEQVRRLALCCPGSPSFCRSSCRYTCSTPSSREETAEPWDQLRSLRGIGYVDHSRTSFWTTHASQAGLPCSSLTNPSWRRTAFG